MSDLLEVVDGLSFLGLAGVLCCVLDWVVVGVCAAPRSGEKKSSSSRIINMGLDVKSKGKQIGPSWGKGMSKR